MRKLEYADLFWQVEEIRAHHGDETYTWKTRVLFLDITIVETKVGEQVIRREHKVRNQFWTDQSRN